MIEKKLVVVTGGAGFIGSHLIENLISDYRVISIDNYFTGTEKPYRRRNLYKRMCFGDK